MGMLERTNQIVKFTMEDTGTASRTQNEKASSCWHTHLVVANTYFQNKYQHLITYKSSLDTCKGGINRRLPERYFRWQ